MVIITNQSVDIFFYKNCTVLLITFSTLQTILFPHRLFLPQFRGAQTLYTKFLRPALLQYSGDLDAGINKLKAKAQAAVKDGVTSLAEAANKTD